METTETQINYLNQLPLGARLHIRSKTDWRSAVISQIGAENVTIIVCSPTGRTYRLRKKIESEIAFDGEIPILKIEVNEDWRENFSKYDVRW